MAKALPLLGLGNLNDIANACIYLLSDASRWVTGSNLVMGDTTFSKFFYFEQKY